jgi:hypothetical protein
MLAKVSGKDTRTVVTALIKQMSAMRAKPLAASIFTLHYDGSTFWLPFCTYSLFFVRWT